MMKIDEYLTSLETFGIKLGLAQTAELMNRADCRIEKNKKPYFIHLAGSNGKGSCGAMLQTALQSAGKKVGFYTSPHLVNYNERIRINGRMISDSELESEHQKLSIHAEAMKKEGKFVTYFEYTTILALTYFLHNDVDFIVWETGMGGRFDSTNVIDCDISVITNIALEHCQYLGDTLKKIDFEKGGIIKENSPVFCGIMPESARNVLKNIAAEKNAPFCAVEKEFEFLGIFDMKQQIQTPDGIVNLALAGEMQRRNFALVYQVLKYASEKFSLDLQKMLDSMAHVSWPGRFQIIADGSIIDGGHNPDGTAALAKCLKEYFPNEKFSFVFASFEDKDTKKCIKNLLDIAADFAVMPLAYSGRPSCSAERLEKLIHEIDGNFANVKKYSSLKEYFNDSEKSAARKVYCGSLYLLGEYLQHSDPRMLEQI